MALPPLFGRTGLSAQRSIEDEKQDAFMKLKAICVPLLQAGRAPTTSDSARSLLHLLKGLEEAIQAIPVAIFTSALANYAFFPLSSLLQASPDGRNRSEAVLEATMTALGALVRVWRCSPGGMDARVLQELWIMGVLRLGGPLDPAGPQGKGKAKEVELAEETKHSIVQMLCAIMDSSTLEGQVPVKVDQDEDPLGEDIDWTADDPFSAPPKTTPFAAPEDAVPPPLPPTPIIFHTLTTLTSLAEIPSSFLALQLSAIHALRVLFERYLVQFPTSQSSTSLPPPTEPTLQSFGPSPFVATALPGTASALSRVALSVPRSSSEPVAHQARRQVSAAVVASLDLLGVIITSAVADELTTALRHPYGDLGGATLEELGNDGSERPDSNSQGEPVPSTLTTNLIADAASKSSGPALPTPAWLSHTIANLSTLFLGLSGLSSHDAPQVRVALVHLLDQVLSTSGKAFGDSKGPLLETLLLLSSDDWDEVSIPAKNSLTRLFSEESTSNALLAGEAIRQRLLGIPPALHRADEHKARDSARIVVAALRVLPTPSKSTTRFLAGIERWSWILLRALDFQRILGAGSSSTGGMAQAWITTGNFEENPEFESPWPSLSMRHVTEERTKRDLEVLWRAMGRWASTSKQSGPLVDQFLGVATGARSMEGAAISALSVLDGILCGMKDAGESKASKKVVRGVVRSVLELLEGLEVDSPPSPPDATDPLRDPNIAADSPSDTSLMKAEDGLSVTVEHQRGVALTPGLDSLNPVALTPTDFRASHDALTACFCLRLLSTSASILTSAFQPYLLQTLYHVLSYISPTSHPLLRRHGQLALARIAYWTSYASPQNLVLANVDYVVNSVSQRLSISRLNPAAPLVLVEMIRLVGEPILPMVQDLVEDVFEALDDYHGYEELTLGLWGVLDALMRVMSGTVEAVPQEDPSHGDRLDPVEDWKLFCDWHTEKSRHTDEEEEDESSANPQTPFESNLPDDKSAEFPSDVTPPATRTQLVGAQILSKALYFLSHSSPFLRSRVLSLIAAAVPLFAAPSDHSEGKVPSDRQSDLLPVIHRAWPYILNRLADPEPYVVLEAAGLLESLAMHVGDFMSRRILDDVWPRFRTILERQSTQDQQSAIAGQSPYTVSHRINRAIISAMMHVARSVPLKETILWEQAVLFRRFLDAGLDSELQAITRELYAELGRVNQEIIWLVLSAAQGSVANDELPIFLRMEKYNIALNAELILRHFYL